jgi:O-acetyl-ADP-ribose deacetylase (regulator of RNase III)
MGKHDIKNLYYITHVKNLSSILNYGIFSHALIEERKIDFTRIYDLNIVSHREQKQAPNGKSLWTFANLYFQPRNPMLYRVTNEKGKDEIAVVAIKSDVMNKDDIFVSTGNAASLASDILPAQEGLKEIAKMKKIMTNDWWSDTDGSKRKIMAECLVPNIIPPEFIDSIYVSSHYIQAKVEKELGYNLSKRRINVIPEPKMFFQPVRRIKIGNNLSLAEGDMFFSQMQTLTVSVNTVGVMGKGLASRAKYQFPDVYVKYQDACKAKQLTMEKPYLYKREASLDEELSDNAAQLQSLNATKWFLLFATKRHWREDSSVEDIEKGLHWVERHYSREKITSLAMPALGCGLGNLEWKEVGPLMCAYLSRISIPVAIYLPIGKSIPEEQLRQEFLLPAV